jgi:cysteine desulfurase
MSKNKIYLDYASTTPVDPRVLKAMLPYFTDKFENPSSIYSGGLLIREAIEDSRQRIAKFLNCQSEEVIFTSGGTEADNLAILGYLEKYESGHIITSLLEHPAVLEVFKKLEKKFDVTYLEPDSQGIVRSESLKKALQKDTLLVSIMYANNEIGTVQPIKEYGKILENHKAVLHTDACQATLYLPMDVQKLKVDMLTLNGSKIYAPKGVGLLYKKSNILLSSQIIGGEQESGLRAGTENVPAIVGLAKAIELVTGQEAKREKGLRDYAISKLKFDKIISFNGSLSKRLPNNINLSIKGVEGESILLDLDHQGIAVSTGSACSSRDLKPSRVISSIKGEVTAHESIRVSIGRFTSRREIDIFINALKKSIKRFQEMSPYGRS